MEPGTGLKMEELMQFTERVNRITVSPTMAVLQQAEKYKAKPVGVVDFGPAEPYFPTPDNIKCAAILVLDENRTEYTPATGIIRARQAICDRDAAQLGLSGNSSGTAQ